MGRQIAVSAVVVSAERKPRWVMSKISTMRITGMSEIKTPTPRTDKLKIPSEALLLIGQKGVPEKIVQAILALGDHARQLERELSAARRELDEAQRIAINKDTDLCSLKDSILNMSHPNIKALLLEKAQMKEAWQEGIAALRDELAQARDGALEEAAKACEFAKKEWHAGRATHSISDFVACAAAIRALKSPAQGATSTAPQELALEAVAPFVIEARNALLETPADSQEAYHWLYQIQALVPNYDPYKPWIELERIAALKSKPSPARGEPQSTAPQRAVPSERPLAEHAVAAAVPDDPVAVWDYVRHIRTTALSFDDSLRALARHYEARGMRKAAEIAEQNVGFAAAEKILSAAADLERKP